ncbi:MAG: HlyD family efflux transporter periplasmic adaptor subunit [Muribaculaceae bacterium]|nr:HlyD family efflux transporter periplasmic adaptor subunit [Muribaculaceae bacterium]
MDKEIPKSEQRRRRMKYIGMWIGATITVGLMLWLAVWLLAPSVKRSEIILSQAETGTVESTVTATGHVVPAFEQILVSPVATRIVELYCREGDSVTAGTPLLRLDLQSTEIQYQRLNDELAMKRYEIEQSALEGHTRLTNLEMQIEAKEMTVDQLKAEAENERRLDSIGSGTGERVRQAVLAYRTGVLELEQLRKQLANERRIQANTARSKQLEEDISVRNLSEAARTLDDAKVRAPISGTVTYLNNSIGASIGAGEKVAVLSDLTHLKVEAEIAEGHGDKLHVGAPVTVRVGRHDFSGRLSSMNARSKSGMISFIVTLDKDNAPGLRAGLNAQAAVLYDIHEDVIRIANGSYYKGPGSYELFVVTKPDRLERRRVLLGDSNPDWVEVKSGIAPGEEVLISNLNDYEMKQSLRLTDK